MTDPDDELFETLDHLDAGLDGPPADRARALLAAIAPIARDRPDLVAELLRYPARALDALGLADGPSLEAWLRESAPGEAGWLLADWATLGPHLQAHVDDLRAGRESWQEPGDPGPLMRAIRAANEGRLVEAADLYDALAEGAAEPLLYRFEAARLRARAGDPGPAERLLDDPALFPHFRARLLALLGHAHRALAELEGVVADAPGYAFDEEEDFEGLRGHPEYARLLARAGAG